MRTLSVSSAPLKPRMPEAGTAELTHRHPRQSLDALLGPQPGAGLAPRTASVKVEDPTFEVASPTCDFSRPTGYHLALPESPQTYLNPLVDLPHMLPPEHNTNGDSVSVRGERNFFSVTRSSTDEKRTNEGNMVEYLTKRVEELQLQLDTLGENWKKVSGSPG